MHTFAHLTFCYCAFLIRMKSCITSIWAKLATEKYVERKLWWGWKLHPFFRSKCSLRMHGQWAKRKLEKFLTVLKAFFFHSINFMREKKITCVCKHVSQVYAHTMLIMCCSLLYMRLWKNIQYILFARSRWNWNQWITITLCSLIKWREKEKRG